MAPPSVNSSQHAANAGRMIKATRARITTATTRPCSQCHKPVPTYQTWKMCDACRERCRTISLERRRRQRETGGMFSIFKVDLSAGYTGPQKATKRPIDNEDNGGVGEEGSVRIVKRSRKDSETEDVDRTSNCKENENATNTICENGDHQERVLESTSEPIEFQTPSDLYNALPSQLFPFHACYTIVSTASPSISLTHRVQLVSHELRKELNKVGVEFNPYCPTQQTKTVLSSSHSFACNVDISLSSPTPGPSMTTTITDPTLNSTQIELSRYFGRMSTQSSASLAELFGTAHEHEIEYSNNGTVKITVEDDFSHPWGIRGHHVIIKIDLPRV